MPEQFTLSRTADIQKIIDTLVQYGVAIIPHALTVKRHANLYAELAGVFEATEFSQGLFYGNRTKRFGRVLSRSSAAQDLVMNDLALSPARAVLGPHCQDIQLNLTQGIEIWPGSFAQVPHRDQDIWLGAPKGTELMINAMWALDDFTAENGATLVWPGSHRSTDPAPATPGIPVQMPRGSLCLFLGSTLHAGGPNWSGNPRRGLVVSYCAGWLKPCENPWLSYPPEVARNFAPALARLAGYRMDAPSLNHVDGRCPVELLSQQGKENMFADNLTDEQNAQIEAFNRQQCPASAAA